MFLLPPAWGSQHLGPVAGRSIHLRFRLHSLQQPSMGPAPKQPAIQPKRQILAGHGPGSFAPPPQDQLLLLGRQTSLGAQRLYTAGQGEALLGPELVSGAQQLRLCGR